MNRALPSLLAVLLAWSGQVSASAPNTLRVDIQHGGDAASEHYALERVVVEPLPWPGNPARAVDASNRGSQKFEVADATSGALLYSRGYSTVFGEARRAKLRAERRPESEMNALFHEDRAHTTALFSKARHRNVVGAFQGANYSATGYYRPQLQCLMFDRSEAFCAVCSKAVGEIIDLYSRQP